jgi:hypothetical protein
VIEGLMNAAQFYGINHAWSRLLEPGRNYTGVRPRVSRNCRTVTRLPGFSRLRLR